VHSGSKNSAARARARANVNEPRSCHIPVCHHRDFLPFSLISSFSSLVLLECSSWALLESFPRGTRESPSTNRPRAPFCHRLVAISIEQHARCASCVSCSDATNLDALDHAAGSLWYPMIVSRRRLAASPKLVSRVAMEFLEAFSRMNRQDAFAMRRTRGTNIAYR